MAVELLGDNELKNGVAQKLESLVIEMFALRFMAQARMRERFRQQKRVGKFVIDAVFERIHGKRMLSPRGEFSNKERRFETAVCFGRRLHTAAPCSLPLLENPDRRHQVERPLQHRIVRRGLLRIPIPALRCFHRFELGVLA